MGFICVTNNEMLYEKYKENFEIRFYDISLKEIMVTVRDMVHSGHTILTHPLSGSVKPGETTVKSVFVSKQKGALNTDSLMLIESSIAACDKFVNKNISYKKSRNDFETIDLSLAESAIHAMGNI